MKFSEDDPVYIKSLQEEGKIVKILDKQSAKVMCKGKSFVALLSDLEHPYLNWFLNKNKQNQHKNTYIDQIKADTFQKQYTNLKQGVYLLFFPHYPHNRFDENLDYAQVFLLNNTLVHYNYFVQIVYNNTIVFELETDLLSQKDYLLINLNFEQLSGSPRFIFRFDEKDNPKKMKEWEWTLKPKKLLTGLNEVEKQQKAFFFHILFEKLDEPKTIYLSDKKEITILKNSDKKSHFDFSNIISKNKYEYDLHIEKLTSEHSKLSNEAKLQIQLESFEKAIDLALATHQRSIVFIHGVGKGTLKKKIHEKLFIKKQTKQILHYVCEYDTRYGYGATEVFFTV